MPPLGHDGMAIRVRGEHIIGEFLPHTMIAGQGYLKTKPPQGRTISSLLQSNMRHQVAPRLSADSKIVLLQLEVNARGTLNRKGETLNQGSKKQVHLCPR